MKKVCIFGCGKKYESFKKDFRKDIKIECFFDNDSEKWGKYIDGIEVMPPKRIVEIEFDYIFILCSCYFEIREQVESLGIPREKIFDITRKEKILKEKTVKYYNYCQSNPNKKHVLIVSHTLNTTGAPLVLFYLILVLAKNDYQIKIYSVEDGEQRKQCMELGIDVVIAEDMLSHEDEWSKLVDWANIVVVNSLPMYYLVEDLEKRKKTVLWWIHEYPLNRWIDLGTYKRIESSEHVKICGVSEKVKRLFENSLKAKKMSVLLPGVPLKPIKENIHSKIQIGYIGYFSDEIKGLDVLADAIELTNSYCKGKVEYSFVGSGELSEYVRKKIDGDDNVRIIGEVPSEQMDKIYEGLDVVVCASRMESLSMVVIEALSYNKVTIISSAAGIAYYIDNMRNGIVFETENARDLSEKIKWVVDNWEDARRISREGRKLYEKMFSYEDFSRRVQSIVEELQK